MKIITNGHLPSRLELQNTPTASLQRGMPPPPANECP